MKNKYHHLSFEERFVIEKLHNVGVVIRRIAKFLGRSPNTVSSESIGTPITLTPFIIHL